jgi:hypothetical protein
MEDKPMLCSKGRLVWWLTCLGVALVIGGSAAPAAAGGGPGEGINPADLNGPYIYGVTTLARGLGSSLNFSFVGTYIPSGENPVSVTVTFTTSWATLPTFDFHQLTLDNPAINPYAALQPIKKTEPFPKTNAGYFLTNPAPGDYLKKYLGQQAFSVPSGNSQGLPQGPLYIKSLDSLSWASDGATATVHTVLSYAPTP